MTAAPAATLRGWGPDYSEVEVTCSATGCTWSQEWDTEQGDLTLQQVIDAVRKHASQAHVEV